MPVSHLGLTVSHIPSSTSFYLAALQPLDYRFLGTQGNTVGLGVRDADLFLCPTARGVKLVPAHVAFTAKSRVAVRECYSAALGAGGWPSGAPSYRNDDCSCFNAAVEDLDGNTVEFIYRERDEATSSDASGARYGVRHGRERPFAPPARSKTAPNVAKATLLRTPTSNRSDRMPIVVAQPDPSPTGLANDTSRALMGTLLGAAAGAAFAFAMVHAERDGAHKEAAFSTTARSRGRDAAKVSRSSHRSMSERPTIRGHRGWTEAQSRYTADPRTILEVRQPLAIAYETHEEREDSQSALIHHAASSRPQPPRSKTYDVRSSGKTTRSTYVPRRSTTVMEIPSRQPLLLRSAEEFASRHEREPACESTDEPFPRRRDSVFSTQSYHSSGYTRPSKDEHRSITSEISTVRPPQGRSDGRRRTSDSTASHRTYFSTRSHRSRAIPYFDASERVQEPMSYDDVGVVSDGMEDTRTIVPDDSISCVDLSRPRPTRSGDKYRSDRSHRRHRLDRRTGERSDTANSSRTVNPSKSRHSAATLPTRVREQIDEHRYPRKQDAASYA